MKNQKIDIEETEIGEESARLLRAVVGEHLSRIELAAVLARSFQQPGFLPLPVLEAFLLVAQRSARLPSVMVEAGEPRPSSDENESLLDLLRGGEWLDNIGERASVFSESKESPAYAADADVAAASERMMKKFGPLHEKLAK